MEKRIIDVDNITNSTGGVNFEIPLSNDFATGLQQNDLLSSNYLDEVKNSSINKIVDYEKYLFYPAYLNNLRISFTRYDSFVKDDKLQLSNQTLSGNLDDYACDVNKIIFNLYLKRREHDDNNNYGSWESSDEYYWNRWNGETKPDGKKTMDDELSTKNNGDLLGCLGFDDDDVLYQKNNLKKSFLRISIYDSPYRQTQKLLYYSTLFFDTNKLYEKYTNLVNNYKTTDTDRVYQYQGLNLKDSLKDTDKLTATFTCTSKNDNTASSDGFYLYLFKNVVDRNKTTRLYMKIEFNNAKYGKTIVLTNPRDKNIGNLEIKLDDNNFPMDYEITGNGDNSYVDIGKFYNDLYIPIFVRYNNKKNRYEWYVAENNSKTVKKEKGCITINLYEPRINKLKPKQV